MVEHTIRGPWIRRKRAAHPHEGASWFVVVAAFLFLYFLKTFFTEIYFRFHILQFYTPTARQGGGRDLHVNKYNFFLREGTYRPVEGRQAARPSGRRAADSPPKYKS